MATFGKSNFNTAVYAAFRPTYPQELYDFIFEFHKRSPDARHERAIDLGCGTGQATVELKPFRYVTGVDPSECMIRSSREIIENRQRDDKASPIKGQIVDFVQGSAEKLDFLSDSSVDLVISAEACHWFNWSTTWPELARVMRKGATAAFWIYSIFCLPQYPTLTPLIDAYTQGTDPDTSLGPYWQQPGWTIFINHLVDVPEPNDLVPGAAFEPLDRVYFTGAYYPAFPSARPVVMRKVMSWEDLLEYVRSFSALHTFKERNPSDADHPEGPLEVRFWNALRDGATRAVGGRRVPDEVVMEYPVVMVLARKAV